MIMFGSVLFPFGSVLVRYRYNSAAATAQPVMMHYAGALLYCMCIGIHEALNH